MSIKEVFASLQRVYRYLMSKWLLIAAITFVGVLFGLIYTYYKPTIYVADTTFVLEDNDKSGGLLGQYGGIASMVGIDVAGGNNGIFQGDNILELYKSRNMIRRALLSSIENTTNKKLIDYYIDFSNLKKQWTSPSLKYINFDVKPNISFSRLQDSVIDKITDDISKNNLNVSRPDKKLSIIEVETKSTDEFFAKNFNLQVVKTVNDFYIETKTKKALQNLSVLQKQTDSVRNILNDAIYNTGSTTDATPNLNPNKQVLRIPIQRAQINVETNKAILTQLVQNLELAKISIRRETPLIQIIDQPIYPLVKEKTGRVKGMIVGGFLFGLISTLLFTLSFTIRKIIKGLISE
ncbi:Wzz/FepE/Etk N-terminal domain-containing protein [Mucilaginibacter sp. HD30]